MQLQTFRVFPILAFPLFSALCLKVIIFMDFLMFILIEFKFYFILKPEGTLSDLKEAGSPDVTLTCVISDVELITS